MKPFQTLAQVRCPDGSNITLHEHDGEHYIKHNGRQLMSTIATVSELLLADLGCRHLRNLAKPRVLIGGLGLGFTLKRVLEIVGPNAVVHVSELLPEVVQWNRELLGKVNGHLLDDPRVEVIVKDVFKVIHEAKGEHRYDSILLDTDHTPSSWVQAKNVRLYERAGFVAVSKALRSNGLVAYWSAGEEPEFVQNLSRSGFRVQTYEAKAHPTAKRAVHRIYVGEQRPKEEGAPAGAPSQKQASKGAPGRPAPGAGIQRAKARRLEREKASANPFMSPARIAGLERKEMLRAERRPSSKK
ncbi:MAG: spermine synthase [Verrucomicrobiota bacterium]